jgi:hypothetical protein
MENKSKKTSNDITLEIPSELFEESGIPTDGGFQFYCDNGKIVITELIDDEFICDENCDNCPCQDKCDADCKRQQEIHSFVSSLSPEEQEFVQVQIALKQSKSIDDAHDIFDKLSTNDLKCLIVQLILKWASKTED